MRLLAEQAKTLALVRREFLRQFAERFQSSLTARCLQNTRAVTLAIARRAIGIVKIKDGSLRVAVRRAVAIGKKRVALDFDGPALIRLHDERNRPAARRHGRCEILRSAMDEILRRLAEGHEFVLRLAAAGARQTKAREDERRGHDLYEVPARNRVGQLARARREIAFQELAEL